MREEDAKRQIIEICESCQLDAEAIVGSLGQYEQELIRWQKIKNLVSRETLNEIWSRHFLDSVQLYTLFPQDSQRLLDFGSGGGLPAIPLAIMGKSRGLSVTMVEANGRKCSFLRQLGRLLGLAIEVRGERAEALEPISDVDLFTARGFASLDVTFGFLEPHFSENSSAFLQKGRGYKEELKAAAENWRYDYQTIESLVAPESVILDIRGLKRR